MMMCSHLIWIGWPKMAFPLISLQYNELQIEFRIRPLNHMFVVRDIDNVDNNNFNETPYTRANQNLNRFKLIRFLVATNLTRFIQKSDPNCGYFLNVSA